jgi:hypothetical protein
LEVGRPPGLRAGSDLDTAFAFPVLLPLEPGHYRWEIKIDDALLETLAFEVLALPPGFIAPGAQPPPA